MARTLSDKLRIFSKTRFFYYLSGALVLCIWFLNCLPSPLFNDPYTTVLLDKNGKVISAKIASDKQWRFPEQKTVPRKFAQCLIAFEDKNFFSHRGVDPFSICRAFVQNIKKKRTVSGGSTISMQVIRLSRKNKKRSYFEKSIEVLKAFRLEFSYSKFEILSLYASHAPFGGNIVGLDAASWRYFGRSPGQLSWAECAMLAVLPNAPSLIYPGKNQSKLKLKRNRLLDKLYAFGIIDAETLQLSKQEELPQHSYPIPQQAPHLLNRYVNKYGEGQRIAGTLDADLQRQVNAVTMNHQRFLKANEIHNAAVLVAEINTGKVLCYLGNTPAMNNEDHGNDVDIINAPRSTGSLLKPYLYASMMNEGELLPNMLIQDIPTQIGGFTPQNFNLTYDGAVPAKRALARSLNIPAVKMLQLYGLEKFHAKIKQLGMTTITQAPGHYGMSIILGGSEGKLWDMVGIYASMARTLNHYNKYNSHYFSNGFRELDYIADKKVKEEEKNMPGNLSAAAIWLTFEAMAEVSRPDIDASWRRLGSGQKIAWKTGTSFGFRDGWAIGLTPDYVVGVWVGNADGEGRPALTGISAAAPLLFEVFGLLPKRSPWFSQPLKEMKQVKVCAKSGHRASVNCPETKKEWVPSLSEKTIACPYHKIIHLDTKGKFRVSSECESVSNMISKAWFILPPTVEYYYKTKNPTYVSLPPYRPGCAVSAGKAMDMIYPKNGARIYVPIDLNSEQSKAVFELAHRNPQAIVYWHLDEVFIGSTQNIHQMGLNPAKGKHLLTLVDEQGETLSLTFEVLSEKKNE
ncbi:MAG: penicillin-binding protein 1C [Bacteroidia bacterium]